ncbi:MAG: DUF255 domain-containing protein [Gammaproteobacteria bacterium]|nr:DUF255 domain-containing protein [Gammaproteobacteria bacterium]MDH5730525.1 DUF255 domain-containing protein [Gammaproteobacteria bacterium]
MATRRALGLILFLLAAPAWSTDNQQDLKQHISPYVVMHADDKVRWHLWNEASFALAKKNNKPVLVSLGYFSCYWCHVMQRENFLKTDVADIINKNFIAVIVDRELEPELDRKLAQFMDDTAGRSGWPMHVVITPDGYPIMGSLYMPNNVFKNWLLQVAGLWQEAPDYVATEARDQLLSHKRALTQAPITHSLVQTIQNKFMQQVWLRADSMSGGFGEQAKFPSVPVLTELVRRINIQTDTKLKEFLVLTLDSMASLALNDALSGGFFRYTADPQWSEPHYEKMLYDNAQLASLYLHASEVLNNPYYKNIGLQTIEFMLNHMRRVNGLFISSFSAMGSDGEEGSYYLWSAKELKQVLTASEFGFAKKHMGLNTQVSELGYLPLRLNPETEKNQERYKQFEVVRAKLLAARDKRELAKDQKPIAAWNALVLTALLDAYRFTKEERYKHQASEFADQLVARYWHRKNLYRFPWRKNQTPVPAVLSDYVFVAQALWQTEQTLGGQKYHRLIEKLIQQAWIRFYDERGWRSQQNSLLRYAEYEAVIMDDVLFSQSSSLILLTQAWQKQSKKKSLSLFVPQALAIGHDLLNQYSFWYPKQTLALDNYLRE